MAAWITFTAWALPGSLVLAGGIAALWLPEDGRW